MSSVRPAVIDRRTYGTNHATTVVAATKVAGAV